MEHFKKEWDGPPSVLTTDKRGILWHQSDHQI